MSIKNKFATAVATASLLAGLFGSAFVPSALATVVDPADAVVPKYTTLTEGGAVHRTTATSKVFGFQTLDSNADDNEDNAAWIAVELFSDGAAGVGDEQYDFELTKNENVLLTATSSNSAVQVGFGYDVVDSSVEACQGANMVFGTSATVLDVDGTDEGPGIADSAYKICLRAKYDDTAATSTITVTVGSVVATTFTVTAVGPVVSIAASITDGYKNVAEDNDYLDEWLTVIFKDAAGIQINGDEKTVSNENVGLTDWTDQVENQQTDQISALGETYGDTIGLGTAYVGYDLDSYTCVSDSGEEDGDATHSYALKFQDDLTGDIVSNAVTILCTLNSEGARITAVTPEVTSATGSPNNDGGYTYEETAAGSDDWLMLVGTVVDANGTPLGDGAADVDFDWSIEGDSDLNFDDYNDEYAVGGEIELGDLTPDTTRFGRFTYTLTANDSDLAITYAGDDAVAKSFTKTFTALNGSTAAVITKVRNAAKTTAVFTADMGEDAAFDVVSFTVELKNGTVVVYDRRANANGVAKLTLSKRNTTIFVYGSYLADTNVMKCVFR
jgi:hypothetical protein